MKIALCTAGLLAALAMTSSAGAADKPAAVHIGISTFLSGQASVFGVPGKEAAEILADDLNKRGGLLGVPVELTWLDEGAGAETLLNQYRQLTNEHKVDVFFASISSGNCNKVARLAEDLKVMNLMWDCGTEKILEGGKFRYVFRPQSYATPEMIAPLLYLLQTHPAIKTIAVVNQDYAWGRDSWAIYSQALKQLRPDVKVVAELFPKFGAADFSTEVTRLLALKPDVVLSTAWGGDLDTFVRQSAQRGLTRSSLFVLPLGESSLERLGADFPEGAIVATRGDNWFLNPEYKDKPAFKAFVEAFKTRTGHYPIYPVFHMAQTFAALEAAYAKAAAAQGGAFPSSEQVVDAMEGVTFEGYARKMTIRADHQATADQLVGVAHKVPGYDFPVLDKMKVYPAEKIMPAAGIKSADWISGLSPDFVNTDGEVLIN